MRDPAGGGRPLRELDDEAIETPVGVIEVDRVRANARKAAEYCTRHALAWRPHIKTHKCLEVARIQLEAGARGLTVATPREAEVMAVVTDDLLLAYPPVGRARLDRILALPERVDLKVALDSADVAGSLGRAASEAGREVGVLVELDVGLRRVGLQGPEEVVRLAGRVAELPGLTYRGVLFYPGHLREPLSEDDPGLRRVAEALGESLEALREAGLAPDIVSGGSTPTLWRSHEMRGVTEVRSGSWIFNDREGVTLGVADWDELAYTVLATVVSTAVPGRAVVDAGSKALAKESRGGDDGFGVLLGRPSVRVAAISEEHGVLDLADTDWHPRIGERVRIVPNHVCVSVNLQDRLLAHEDGRLEEWALEARGRRRAPVAG